jgi:SAM-dependent methyltransferase
LPFRDNGFDAATMALVIVFVADPAKAVAEMARVVRPGGLVAAYMWEFPDGTPVWPLSRAMKALGFEPPQRPNVQASARDAMRALWQAAGLRSLETDVIRIRVHHRDFDEFWTSITAPTGPSGKALSQMPASAREQLKAYLREHMRAAADGTISYEAYANAVKGVR